MFVGGGRDMFVDSEWTPRWAATVGYTADGRPLCSEVADGVFAFGGYNATGNLVGPVAARAAVALAFDGSPVPDYFCL